MFGGPWRIGSIQGVPVLLYPSSIIFVLLFATLMGGSFQEGFGLPTGLGLIAGVLVAVLLYATLLFHEFGHMWTARAFGIPADHIALSFFGGRVIFQREAPTAGQQLAIAVAGPAASLLCAALFGAIGFAASQGNGVVGQICLLVGSLNLLIALLNMLPGLPLDGGRALRALAWMATGDLVLATRVAYWGGIVVGALCAGAGLLAIFSGNFFGVMFLFLGFALGRGASDMMMGTQIVARFDDATVGQLMRPVQAVVPATLSLRRAVDDYFTQIHADRFPVVEGARLLGYLAAEDVAATRRDEWDRTPAARLARPYAASEVVSPDERAMEAFQRLITSGRAQFPVFQGTTLVGMLVLKDLVARATRK